MSGGAGRGGVGIGRRGLLAGLSLLPGAALAALPETVTLLAPGPEEGGCARWAARAAAAMGHALPGTALRLSVLGGPDGVTAANRFSTLSATHGGTLLVLPGGALHARLSGAGRAQFDPGAWLPLCGAWHGAVLAGPAPMPAAPGSPIRVAVPAPDAPEAAALLALDLLEMPARPVAGRPEALLASGEADVALLTGANPSALAAGMGLVPWLHFPPLGGPEPEEMPAFTALAARRRAAPTPLRAALAAVATAQLRCALVLPALTGADAVALWRRAAARWAEEARADPAAEARPLAGAEAQAALMAANPAADVALAYREWAQRRLGLRPT